MSHTEFTPAEEEIISNIIAQYAPKTAEEFIKRLLEETQHWLSVKSKMDTNPQYKADVQNYCFALIKNGL